MDTPIIIDTVALVREIRDNHAMQLQGKTHQERIAFYREQAKKMQSKMADLLAEHVVLPNSDAQPTGVASEHHS